MPPKVNCKKRYVVLFITSNSVYVATTKRDVRSYILKMQGRG